jgi:hypothetical protein
MASDKEETLRLQPSGRWAIICPGRLPVAIVEGEVFELEVAGKMRRARMKHRDGRWFTTEGYLLADGSAPASSMAESATQNLSKQERGMQAPRCHRPLRARRVLPARRASEH